MSLRLSVRVRNLWRQLLPLMLPVISALLCSRSSCTTQTCFIFSSVSWLIQTSDLTTDTYAVRVVFRSEKWKNQSVCEDSKLKKPTCFLSCAVLWEMKEDKIRETGQAVWQRRRAIDLRVTSILIISLLPFSTILYFEQCTLGPKAHLLLLPQTKV